MAKLYKSLIALVLFLSFIESFGQEDYSGKDLTNSILSGKDFTGSNFTGANLKMTNLTSSLFVNANLTNADLRGTFLNYTNFTNATLTGTNFTGAAFFRNTIWPSGFDPAGKGMFGPFQNYAGRQFTNADFEFTKRFDIDFHGSNFTGATMVSVNLTRADFSSADLTNANFSGSFLNYTDLTGAKLDGTNFFGSAFFRSTKWPTGFDPAGKGMFGPFQDYAGRIFSYSDFDLIKRLDLDFHGSNFTGATMVSFNLTSADFSSANLTDANFSGAFLNYTNFTDAKLDGTNFSGSAFFRNTRWPKGFDPSCKGMFGPYQDYAGRIFSQEDFTGIARLDIDFFASDFTGAVFNSLNLTGANFASTNLSGTDFKQSFFNLTDFSNAVLFGTDFSAVNIMSAKFDGARYNSQTKWPQGFDPVAAGANLITVPNTAPVDIAVHVQDIDNEEVPDGVFIAKLTATDEEGGIFKYSLAGCQGDNSVFTIRGDSLINRIPISIRYKANYILYVKVTDENGASFLKKVDLQLLQSMFPVAGLIGWWPFNGNANDESGSGNNGVPSNAILSADRNGRVNSAYQFNGTDAFIDIPNNFFDNGAAKSTISFWFRPSQIERAGGGFTIMNTKPHNGLGIGFSYAGSGKVYVFKNSNPEIVSWDILSNDTFLKSDVKTDQWYHCVIVSDGLNYQYYINGNLDKTFSVSGLPASYLCSLRFGAAIYGASAGEFFKGELDDIGIWNRVLTEQEIVQLFQHITPSTPNTPPSDIQLSSAAIRENLPPGTTVGKLTAVDNEGGSMVYELASGDGSADNSLFTVLGSELISAAIFDFEIRTSYSIRLKVTDAAGGTIEKNFTITITDAVNESMPVDGLVAWYPFNGNANDESGGGLHGTVNGPKLTTDRFGNINAAYDFAANQEILVPNSGSKNLYPLSISLWYKLDSIESRRFANIFRKYLSASWNGYSINACDCSAVQNNNETLNNGYGVTPWYLRSTSNKVIGYYGEPPFMQKNLDLKRWYHFVFSVDQNGGKIYVNGELVDQKPWTGDPGPPSSNFLWQIGGGDGGLAAYFGKIDDIGIYNKALSIDEVRQLYTADSRLAQTISFTLPAQMTIAQSPYTLTATSTSNGPIVFSLIEGNASITGDKLTLMGTGPIKIKATQAGTEKYLPAETLASSTVVVSQFLISGLITKPGNIPLGSGLIKLFYENGGLALSGPVTNGIYTLGPLQPGRYILQVVPTGNADNEVFPAYYNAALLNKDATVIDVQGNTTVNMELPAKPGNDPKGTGEIKGKVIAGNGGGRFIAGRIADGVGLPNVPVYLLDNTNKVIKTSTTDKDGLFSFLELVTGAYKLALDVVGASLGSTATNVSITQENPVLEVSAAVAQVNGQPAVVFEVDVVTSLRNELEEVNVYPNPGEGDLMIIYRSNASETITFDLIDLNGRSLKRLTQLPNLTGEYSLASKELSLTRGIYFLKVRQGSQIKTIKVIRN